MFSLLLHYLIKFLYTISMVKHSSKLSVYLYYDGIVESLGSEHLPFAILAVVVLLVFNISPIVLATSIVDAFRNV